MDKVFDYIIIGAGSAGCVVATRLLEANAGSVLLLEAGEPDSSIFHKIPATVVKVFQKNHGLICLCHSSIVTSVK